MNTTTIIIIVCCALLFLFISFIVFIRISNHKKTKKLQENLKKYKNETDKEEKESASITIAANKEGQNISEDEIFGGTEPKDESFFTISKNESKDDNSIENDIQSFDDLPPMPKKPSYREEEKRRRDRDKEFEEFLDDHAFSRKVFDKSLLEKLQELPPEIKSIIMGNVFDKFDDDK